MPTADSIAATKTAAAAKAAAATKASVASGTAREAGQAKAETAAVQRKAAADKLAAEKEAQRLRDEKAKRDAALRAKTPILVNDEILARSKFLQLERVSPKPETSVDSSSGGSSSGGGSSSAVNTATTTNSPAIKVATPDIITIDQETLPPELMTSLIFENIGGQELLNISRHDLISGSNMDYQSIKNLRDIYINNNPLNIIAMPDLSNNYAKNFPIVWESHIVEEFSSLDSTHIYLDALKKELTLLVTNMKPGEQVEVEILSSISGYNSTKF